MLLARHKSREMETVLLVEMSSHANHDRMSFLQRREKYDFDALR